MSIILTHWGRVTHICVSNLTTIGSDNGLSPGWRQAIIWTNAGILLFGPLGTNFNETSIEIHAFSLKKIHLKLSSGKWRPFCLGLNVLRAYLTVANSFIHKTLLFAYPRNGTQWLYQYMQEPLSSVQHHRKRNIFSRKLWIIRSWKIIVVLAYTRQPYQHQVAITLISNREIYKWMLSDAIKWICINYRC